MTPNDADLIARVLAGDAERFGILVDRYQNEFATYAAHVTGSEDDAADVIQDSFVRAYQSLRRCREPENFKGWLFRIVSNQCKTHVARHASRRAEPLESLASAAAPDDPERDAVTGDLRQRVQQALSRLPEDQREALILKYVQDLGVSEIAAMLTVSISALKMRLLRGRQALLRELEGVFE